MTELMLLSLFVGSLGLQAAIAAEWLRISYFNQQQQFAEEEESLTPYNSKDSEMLAAETVNQVKPFTTAKPGGWEFKIVRSSRPIFRNPTVFHHLCEEEAQAGWILLEKLDDQRIRFKRPIALREVISRDSLSFDPYRTQYGSSVSILGALLTMLVLTVMILLPAYLGYTLVTITLSNTRSGVQGQTRTNIPPNVQPSAPPLPATP